MNTTLIFTKKTEPVEGAFSILIPIGWFIEGGIIRLPPNLCGANNSIDAKCDMIVTKDASRSVMLRILPEIMCVDTRYAFGNPEEAIFQECVVRTKRNPVDFLFRVAFPYIHKNEHPENVKIIHSGQFPELASKYQKLAASYLKANPMLQMTYSSGLIIVEYKLNNIIFRELYITIIEDFGAQYGLWKNRETSCVRAPASQSERWLPVFREIGNSVEFNTQWLSREIQQQQVRSGIVTNTQAYLADLDKQISDSRRETQQAINHQMYQTLNDERDYTNPFTGNVETGSNQWKNRWVNNLGEIIYTDDDSYNPNHDKNISSGGFKKAQPKQ